MIAAGFSILGQCGPQRPPGIMCPVHNVPTAVTQSGLQHVCTIPDCEFYVRLQGPQKASDQMSPKAPLATVANPSDKAARKAAIDEAVAKKKAAKPEPQPEAKPNGQPKKKAKADPPADDPPAPTKKAKKAEEPKEDDDMMSVSDVARELGIDPKRARAKLRAGGQAATEGRWPKVKRGSKKYQELVALLAPEPADDEEEEEQEEDADEDEE